MVAFLLGAPPRIEQAAADVLDFSDRGREGVVDDDEVVVRVEREVWGVERALLDPGGLAREFLGERAGHSEQQRPQAEPVKEAAPGAGDPRLFGRVGHHAEVGLKLETRGQR